MPQSNPPTTAITPPRLLEPAQPAPLLTQRVPDYSRSAPTAVPELRYIPTRPTHSKQPAIPSQVLVKIPKSRGGCRYHSASTQDLFSPLLDLQRCWSLYSVDTFWRSLCCYLPCASFRHASVRLQPELKNFAMLNTGPFTLSLHLTGFTTQPYSPEGTAGSALIPVLRREKHN